MASLGRKSILQLGDFIQKIRPFSSSISAETKIHPIKNPLVKAKDSPSYFPFQRKAKAMPLPNLS